MGTCGCHWARGRREAPAAKVAAGGRIPLARHTLRAGGCRRTGRAYAPLHCSLAAALTAMGLRHWPQSGSCRDRARLPQTYAIMGRGRRPRCEAHLRYPAPLAFRAQGLANAESWQDSRAMHDSRGLCSEKGPFLARYSRSVSSNGDLQGFSDAWRAYLAKASSFRMRGGDILPRRGPFPVRGLFWDTPGQNIAIVRHPGTHNVNISPPPGAWECISRAPCRRRTAESALRAHIAMRRPPGNTIRGHMPPCPTAR